MRPIAKTKIMLAIISIAFLLFNPAGICAGPAGPQAAAHPCCPKTACPSPQGSTVLCVCVDRQAVAPSVLSRIGGEQLLAFAQATPVLSNQTPDRLLRSSEFGA